LRIIGVLAVIAILAAGYYKIKEWRAEEKDREYSLYAGLIAETSIAAELYRDDPDSFLVVRDSIFREHNLTLEDLSAFREKMSAHQEEWLKVWDHVARLTDSLVIYHRSRLESEGDSADAGG